MSTAADNKIRDDDVIAITHRAVSTSSDHPSLHTDRLSDVVAFGLQRLYAVSASHQV